MQDQIDKKIKASEVAQVIQDSLHISREECFEHVGLFLAKKLIYFIGDSPKQTVYLTEEGNLYLAGETFLVEYREKVESRVVNLSLVAANLILVIAFFVKDTKTSDELIKINTEMQNIEKAIREKELKASLRFDTTHTPKTENAGDSSKVDSLQYQP